jgi:hypothetical protein
MSGKAMNARIAAMFSGCPKTATRRKGMLLKGKLQVSIFDMFREVDEGCIWPFDLERFCTLASGWERPIPGVNRPVVSDFELYENNGRLALNWQEWDWKINKLFVFKHETVAEIKAALPPKALAWLEELDKAIINLSPSGDKP